MLILSYRVRFPSYSEWDMSFTVRLTATWDLTPLRWDVGIKESISGGFGPYLPTVQGFPGLFRDLGICPGVQGFSPFVQGFGIFEWCYLVFGYVLYFFSLQPVIIVTSASIIGQKYWITSMHEIIPNSHLYIVSPECSFSGCRRLQ